MTNTHTEYQTWVAARAAGLVDAAPKQTHKGTEKEARLLGLTGDPEDEVVYLEPATKLRKNVVHVGKGLGMGTPSNYQGHRVHTDQRPYASTARPQQPWSEGLKDLPAELAPTKDTSYPHGPLANEPDPNRCMTSVMGWAGWYLTSSYQSSAADLVDSKCLSLDALAYEASQEGEDCTWEEVADQYQNEEVYETAAPTTCDTEAWLDWAKQNTKPESWEAVLLWAHGKNLREVGVIQGTSKATAQSRVERTLSRLQKKARA